MSRSSRTRRGARLLVRPVSVLLLAVAALAGCARVGGDATQVAAKVNGTEISLSQLQHAVQRQPNVPPERAEAQARRALEGLVDQELAVQGARGQGLDKDARLVQAVEAARREVLAKAYLDSVAEKAPLPSSDEVDKYYDSQPALFSQRRFYSLQEVAVQGTAEELSALQPRIEALTDPAKVPEALRDAHLKYTLRHLTVSPEDVPIALLGRLSELGNGRSLLVPQPGGARVVTMLSSSPAPITREAARPAIQAYLTNERRRQTVQQTMKAARDAAQIEYKGKFAQAAPQQVGSASAPVAR